MAQDVIMLALALKLRRYAVLGHSYWRVRGAAERGRLPGPSLATVVSGGVANPSATSKVSRTRSGVRALELREQVASSWERESSVTTPDEVGRLLQ